MTSVTDISLAMTTVLEAAIPTSATTSKQFDQACAVIFWIAIAVTTIGGLLSVVLLCLSWKRNGLDLTEDRRHTYYNFGASQWRNFITADRPIFAEAVKNILFITAFSAVYEAVTLHLVVATWCLLDLLILVQICMMLYNNMRAKQGYRCSIGALWFLLLYTITVGFGYGFAKKLTILYQNSSLDLAVYILQILSCVVSCFLFGVGFLNEGMRKQCKTHVAIGVAAALSNVIFLVLTLVVPACTTSLLLHIVTNGTLVCAIVAHEGSLFRNLPEIVHTISTVLCCLVHDGYLLGTEKINMLENPSHPATQLILASLVINVMCSLGYDTYFYLVLCIKVPASDNIRMHSMERQNTVTVSSTPINVMSPAVDQQVMPPVIAQQVEPHTPPVSGIAVVSLGSTAEVCSLCKGQIPESSQVTVSDGCHHQFHANCIMGHDRCPVCSASSQQQQRMRSLPFQHVAHNMRNRFHKLQENMNMENKTPLTSKEYGVSSNPTQPAQNRHLSETTAGSSAAETTSSQNLPLSTHSDKKCVVCLKTFMFEDGVAPAQLCLDCEEATHPGCRCQCQNSTREYTFLCFVCEEALVSRESSIAGIVKECGHVFHVRCIENHVTQTPGCPLCKTEITSRMGIQPRIKH